MGRQDVHERAQGDRRVARQHVRARSFSSLPSLACIVSPRRPWGAKRGAVGGSNLHAAPSRRHAALIVACDARSPPTRTSPPLARFCGHETRATVDVPGVPISKVWEMWQNKEEIPRWMPWITSVKARDPKRFATPTLILSPSSPHPSHDTTHKETIARPSPYRRIREQVQKDDPKMSKWTLSTYQFGQQLEFSWMARDLTPVQLKKARGGSSIDAAAPGSSGRERLLRALSCCVADCDDGRCFALLRGFFPVKEASFHLLCPDGW